MEGIVIMGIVYVFNEGNTGNDYRMFQGAVKGEERKIGQSYLLAPPVKMWTYLFNISVHRKYIPIYVYIQQDGTLHSLHISGNCSPYFGWYLHPSSGTHTTVSTASDACHIVNATCYLLPATCDLTLWWKCWYWNSTIAAGTGLRFDKCHML